jgi:hypothetical protein
MRTKAQSNSSRINGSKSRGPKTPEGKAASSMNALIHGLRANTTVLPTEKQEDFDQLRDSLQEQYQPQNTAEQLLVDEAVIVQWKLVRLEVFERAAYTKEKCELAKASLFRAMMRTQCSLSRAYSKACSDLERIQAARRKQDEPQKGDKPDKDATPRRMRLILVNPETGERRVDSRIQDGKRVEEFTFDEDELKAMADSGQFYPEPPVKRPQPPVKRPRSTGNGAFQPSEPPARRTK